MQDVYCHPSPRTIHDDHTEWCCKNMLVSHFACKCLCTRCLYKSAGKSKQKERPVFGWKSINMLKPAAATQIAFSFHLIHTHKSMRLLNFESACMRPCDHFHITSMTLY